MARSPYPLQWPDGWKRTSYRDTPRFAGQFARDRDSVIHQLKRMGNSNIVVTSDLPTRNDGLPYANATCNDPGIAVWWVKQGKEHVIACDRWRTVALNMRAIDLSIGALRGIDRWGTSQIVEKTFAGFAALPPGSSGTMPPAQPKREWFEVLEVEAAYRMFKAGQFHAADVLAIAKSRHRDRIRTAHPDAGGTTAAAAELNAALADAEKELTRG